MSNIALNKLLIRLGKLYPKYIDLSLKRLEILLKKLNNPHLKLPPTIHIAGTNGKGSTLSFIKHILIENDYKIHCYISPHLESIRERFIIANKTISNKKLYETLKYIELINNKNPITFFEITTAAAFYLFCNKNADFLILETGLGGRCDATNIIKKSMIDIITPISFDHQEYLGKTLKKITNEKLGIIKKNSSVIISKQNKDIMEYIKIKLKKMNNNKLFYGKDWEVFKIKKNKFILSLKNKKQIINKPTLIGNHQIENASLAIASIYEIKKYGYKIKKNKINNGIIKTKWPGRMERLYLKNLPVYLDGAHNVSGAKQLVNFLNDEKIITWLIFGMLKNKDIYLFLKSLSKHISGVIAIKIPDEKNSFTTEEIYKTCKKLNIFCVKQRDIYSAQQYLLKNQYTKRIVVTGSLYLVGKIRKLFKQTIINPIN